MELIFRDKSDICQLVGKKNKGFSPNPPLDVKAR